MSKNQHKLQRQVIYFYIMSFNVNIYFIFLFPILLYVSQKYSVFSIEDFTYFVRFIFRILMMLLLLFIGSFILYYFSIFLNDNSSLTYFAWHSIFNLKIYFFTFDYLCHYNFQHCLFSNISSWKILNLLSPTSS